MNRIVIACLLSMVYWPASTQAAEKDSVAFGKELAELNCTTCHNIEKAGDSPFAAAPPFRTIPQKYDPSELEEAFVEGIVVGHPAMPEWEMTPEQAAALAEFIASLAK